ERDRLKYESQKSKSSSVAVGNDFGFPSPVPDEDFRGRHQEAPKVEEGLREGQ
ncbi:CUEDC1 isoform 6, partial [Pongo abelii]